MTQSASEKPSNAITGNHKGSSAESLGKQEKHSHPVGTHTDLRERVRKRTCLCSSLFHLDPDIHQHEAALAPSANVLSHGWWCSRSSHPQLLRFVQSRLYLLPWFRCGDLLQYTTPFRKGPEWVKYLHLWTLKQTNAYSYTSMGWIRSMFNHTENVKDTHKRCITADRCFPRTDTLSGFRRDSRKHTTLEELEGSMLLMSAMNHAMFVMIRAVILNMRCLVYIFETWIKSE